MMENIKACRECRRLFKSSIQGLEICPGCRQRENEKFSVVKDYVWCHRGCNINEVSVHCNVEEDLIRTWLKEERLDIIPDETGNSIPPLECERCGKPIWKGRYCESCLYSKKTILNTLALEISEPKRVKGSTVTSEYANSKMRYLNRR